MKNRLDEVFSVEKLRRTWKETAPPAREPSFTQEEETGAIKGSYGSTAQASYRRLRAAIERSFPPHCIGTLEPLLRELEQLLDQRFPVDPQAALVQEERAKMSLAIDGLLNRMEDLLEAFEVGSNKGFR